MSSSPPSLSPVGGAVACPRAVSTAMAVFRGARGRCPNCGQGKLLRGYLKAVDRCAACGEAYGHVRADDAAPWMTILVAGHIVVPLILFAERNFAVPAWAQYSLWPGLALLCALGLLPRCKGVVLALIWALKSEGSEEG